MRMLSYPSLLFVEMVMYEPVSCVTFPSSLYLVYTVLLSGQSSVEQLTIVMMANRMVGIIFRILSLFLFDSHYDLDSGG